MITRRSSGRVSMAAAAPNPGGCRSSGDSLAGPQEGQVEEEVVELLRAEHFGV